MIIIPEEWIMEPDEKGNGLLQAELVGEEMNGISVPIETHRVKKEIVTLGKEQEFDFLLEGASEMEVYKNEEDYKKRKTFNMASESIIPSGLFSPDNDPQFVPKGQVIISGTVLGVSDDPEKYGFDMMDDFTWFRCMDLECYAAVYNHQTKDCLEEGNIVSGLFWLQGWPKGC